MTLVHMSAGQLVRTCDLCGTGLRLRLKYPALTV